MTGPRLPDPDEALEIRFELPSDDDRRILRDIVAEARMVELSRAHHTARRAAREPERRHGTSEQELPEAVRRRVGLLDVLARALEPGGAAGAGTTRRGRLQAAAPAADRPEAEPAPVVDPTAEARELLRTYVGRVWGEKDLGALDDLLDPAFRRHVSPLLEPLSLTGQRARLGAIQEAFPDATLEIGDIAVDGDLVAFRSVLRGTHRGQFRGLPPTNQPFTVHLVDLVRIRNGRFVEQWGGPDMLDLLTQLGASVEPGPVEPLSGTR